MVTDRVITEGNVLKCMKTNPSDVLRAIVGRDVVVAFLILGGSLAIMPTVPLPGYLLVIVVDGIQNRWFPGVPATALYAGELLFAYGLAVIAGMVTRQFRRRFTLDPSRRTPFSDIALPLAAVVLVFSGLLLFFGLFSLVQGNVLVFTFGIALVLLVVSAGLVRYTAGYLRDDYRRST